MPDTRIDYRPATDEERAGALALVADIQREKRTDAEIVKEAEAHGDRRVPTVFMPFQARFAEDQADVICVRKSRRIGITWTAAGAYTLMASRRPPRGMSVYYAGYNKEMAAEFIGDCASFARVYHAAATAIDVGFEHSVFPNGEERDILRYLIRLASGEVIQALSSRPAEARGRQGLGILDEAAYHPDIEAALEAFLAWTVWGGRVVLISSLNGADNPFTLLCEEVEAGKRPYSLHTFTFDAALRDGLYERYCFRTGQAPTAEGRIAYREKIVGLYGDGADQELFCVPRMGGETYIPTAVYRQAARPDIPVLRYSVPAEFVLDPDRLEKTGRWLDEHLRPVLEALPREAFHAVGWDFGRTGDLSVAWVWEQESARRWGTALVIEMRTCPFDVQALIRDYLLDGLPRFLHAKFDARGNGASHAEGALQKYGPSRVECVQLTAAWYAYHFPIYRRALEDQTATVPLDPDLMEDHRLVVTERGYPKVSDSKKTKGQDGKPRHGDGAVGAVLGWAATDMPIESYAYHPVRPRPADDREFHARPPGDDDPYSRRPVRVTHGLRGHRGGL